MNIVQNYGNFEWNLKGFLSDSSGIPRKTIKQRMISVNKTMKK